MLSMKAVAGVLLLAGLAPAAYALEGTSVTAWGVGHVRVNDNRILDLSGQYTLPGTTHSLSLRIVQDPRGRLVSTATVTQNFDNISSQILLTGSLHVNGKSPLFLELAGVRPPRLQPTSGGPAALLPPPAGVSIRGALVGGDHFHLFIEVRGFGGGSRFQADLVPEKAARGMDIDDAAGITGPHGALLTTRTVTLPWGVRQLPGVEIRRFAGDQFRLGVLPVSRPGVVNPPPPVQMELLGKIDSENGYHLRRNTVRVGYGNLDSTSSTVVQHTAE